MSEEPRYPRFAEIEKPMMDINGIIRMVWVPECWVKSELGKRIWLEHEHLIYRKETVYE